MENVDPNKIDNVLNIIEQLIDISNIDDNDDVIIDYFFGEFLYNLTTINHNIREYGEYVSALIWLCDKGFEKECNMYAYILNHYYIGEFDKMMDYLIESERYEKCGALKKYKNINTLPII